MRPKISFCGHATNSSFVYLHQSFNFVWENFKRFIQDPFKSDYESIFQSAYYRYKILNNLKNNNFIETNFIFRNKYRAGSKNSIMRAKTTLEYYKNMFESNYVLCLRGTGNFSIRLYETLMMGKIPIFIDTDCILPFPKQIKWTDHVVWIDWSNINNIENIILEFHENISDYNFKNLQLKTEIYGWKN